MPFITAKKNTLLAPLPNQPHLQPLNRLAKVYEGGILGIIKVSAVNSQLAEITLAGPYTWHDQFPTIETGVTRYINPVSWHIPEDAWE
ncbi:glycoside hydrolase family protein, partial [Acaryochloris marina NIES-2412]